MMERMPLLGGAYQSRSLISGAQRCINLYPEKNDDPQAPVPVTHYPTPGLTLRGTPPMAGPCRCVYRATNGALYTVVRRKVYRVSATWVYTEIGTLNVDLPTLVSMADNGLAIVVVDGTSVGYAINMADDDFAQISDPNFYGATRANYVDTFFAFNTPGTIQWQISLPLVTFDNLTAGVITPGNLYPAFDPLDVAGKTGSADPIATLIVMKGNPWPIGTLTSEIWYNSGGADFAFARVPNALVEHGCIAPYSVWQTDTSVFWLAQDREGKALVLRGNSDYSVEIISTTGIAFILQNLSDLTDAIGFCYQQNGHAFYVLTFPTANRTFAVELVTKQWHELAWTDPVNGTLNRHRANCCCYANSLVLVGDWQNGNIYELDPSNFTDNGNPITRLRTIPHIVAKGQRLRMDLFMADLQGGTLTSDTPDVPPKVYLRVSTDRGGSYGNKVEGVFGAAGDYGQFPFWRNLGYARDFVLELSWSEPINTALNGGFFEGASEVVKP